MVNECALESGQWENSPLARILWKHIESQVFPIVGTMTDVLQSAAFENYFCWSCTVHCCPFLQFNCNVAPTLRFHACVISVFKDELIFLKDFKKGKVLVSQRGTDQPSAFNRLVHLSVSRRGTDQQIPL